MGVLIVGDVHGCFYTLRSLVREHWRPEKDTLVLIGDLINKGPHSVRAFKYWLKLNALYPKKTILIRGNHEQWFLDSYRSKSKNQGFVELCTQFQDKGLSVQKVAQTIGQLPLSFETQNLMVSHAGLTESSWDPYDPADMHSLLKNRRPLKRLAKIQVVGHTIISKGKPLFKPNENAWYIDTGAWCRDHLSALRFDDSSNIPKIIQEKRRSKDLTS